MKKTLLALALIVFTASVVFFHATSRALAQPAKCNNGTIDPDELCDGANLAGETCATVMSSEYTGRLTCDRVYCTFDVSGCTKTTTEGDGDPGAGSNSKEDGAPSGSSGGGIAPDADEMNFDPTTAFSNPAQPGVGFCLLNFFCELDPTKNAIESYGYRIFRYVTSFLGIVFISILIYGGFLSLTSFGDEAAAKKGREAIIAAVAGFIVLLLAYAAVKTFVTFARS